MYIGSDSLNRNSYLGSGVLLKQAIKKYGKENFEKFIIENLPEQSTKKDLVEREKYWIKYFNAPDNELFYNLSWNTGGFGKNHRHSRETKEKISKIMKNKVYKNGLPDQWKKMF